MARSATPSKSSPTPPSPSSPGNAGGSKGLLENSTNLCAKPNHANAVFTGHNGKVDSFNPLLQAKCPKKGKKHGKGKHHR